MSQGELNLSEDDFWQNPLRTRDEIEARLLEDDTEALLVDAPREVVLGRDASLPVVVLRSATLANLDEVSFDRQGIIAAVDLHTSAVRADLAIMPTGRTLPPPEESGEPPQEGMGAEAFVIDAMDRLELPEQPGDYVLRVILREQITAPLEVTLARSPSSYEDPEITAFHERERKGAAIPRPWPAFRTVADAPPIPSENGILLSVRRLSVIGETDSLVLTGSYRLPVREQHVLDRRAAGRAPWLTELAEDAVKPGAVVPISLIVTGSSSPTPFVWTLIVPVYSLSADGLTAQGSFAVDLMQLGRLDDLEQTWFLYAMSDRLLAGPVPMAFAMPSSN